MASTAVSSDTTDVISCRSLGCKMALRSDDTDLISCRPLEGLDAKMTPVSSDDTDEDVAANFQHRQACGWSKMQHRQADSCTFSTRLHTA